MGRLDPALRGPFTAPQCFSRAAARLNPGFDVTAGSMGAPAQRSSDSSTTAGTVAPTFSGRPPSLGILIAVTMLGPMALHIFLPSMPGMTAVFDTDSGTIQLPLTLYLAGPRIAQLFMGPLSARFWCRPRSAEGRVGKKCVRYCRFQ